jgi:PKD repeat protein
MTQANAALTYSGPGCSDASGDCKAVDTITFSAAGKGSAPYNFSCATHNYQWNFGDSVTGTGANPTHQYANSGTYAASVTITQGTQSITLTHVVSVNGSSSGGTGSCPTMVADTNVYIAFRGPVSQCSASGGSCNPGESVGFFAFGNQYDYGCDTHTFAWDFGDGGRSTDQNPPHTYATSGTYKVTLHIHNRTQDIDLTATAKVGDGVNAPPRRRASR